jgi:hypothetical protein
MQRVTALKADRKDQYPALLLDDWRQYLQEHDHSPGTVKKYTQALTHFLTWYEREERTRLPLPSLAIAMRSSMSSRNR